LPTAPTKPRGQERLLKITERIGRLKENCHGIAQRYRIAYQTDSTGKKIEALSWTKQPLAGTQMSDPGVYCGDEPKMLYVSRPGMNPSL
jgi:hypothetical protein